MGKISYKQVFKEYFRAGLLPHVFFQILCLGHSRMALELIQASCEFKIQKKLKRKFNKTKKRINEYVPNKPLKEISGKIIWICWLQGLDNAPDIVKKSVESIKAMNKDYSILEITSENFQDYISLPDYIIKKWKEKKISNAHFTDIIRLELLDVYGGIWMDSTILQTGPIPRYIEDSCLFFYQVLKPGKKAHVIYFSNWLIKSNPNNTIIRLVKLFLFDYWKKYNMAIDYHIFHHFLAIAFEQNPDIYSHMPKISSALPHMLLLEWDKKFDLNRFKDIKNFTPIHKLSYKNLPSNDDSFYNYIMNLKFGDCNEK